jgi:hypothetical protein
MRCSHAGECDYKAEQSAIPKGLSIPKIVRFHIQLHICHVPNSKLYLLAAATTLAQLVKILLARDS